MVAELVSLAHYDSHVPGASQRLPSLRIEANVLLLSLVELHPLAQKVVPKEFYRSAAWPLQTFLLFIVYEQISSDAA